MCVRETLYDIVGYISEQKCHGEDIDACIREHLNGVDSNYVLELRVRASNNFIFTMRYTIEYHELCHLDTIRSKVDYIVYDFCNKYEQAKLEDFYKSLTETN